MAVCSVLDFLLNKKRHVAKGLFFELCVIVSRKEKMYLKCAQDKQRTTSTSIAFLVK